MVLGLLTEVTSLVAEHRLWAMPAQQLWLLCSMWDMPGPGIKPVFLALVGGVFTT